ncbi:MAG: hypothetical protein ABSC23_12815 [Bryobacteraceae bacterium]
MTSLLGALSTAGAVVACIFVLTVYGYLFSRVVNRHPTTFSISLLGYPYTGKTVYLTTLFDLLQRASAPGIRFSPYGRETIEQVADNLMALYSGKWLPPTPAGTVFFYRANATIGVGFGRSRYKVEIGDYAGEQIGELNPVDVRWLHKSDYFKYVIQSDGIMLMVDSSMLASGDPARIEEAQNGFIAAFQILAEEKGAVDNRRLRAPVALMFMKTDLLSPSEPEHLKEHFSRLVEVCEARCLRFRTFFVSSTGPLADGCPPRALRGDGVVDPLIWMLRNAPSGESPGSVVLGLLSPFVRRV